jgi:branched-chain amino acid transport system permease protein
LPVLFFETLLQFTLSGITTGCVYTLVAVGIVLCANVSSVINFAQGEYVMVGGLVGASLVMNGMPIWVAVLAAMGLGMVLALIQERLTVAPIYGAAAFMQITVTLGVAVIVRGLALVVWGKDPYGLSGFSGDDVVEVFGAFVPMQAFWVWGITAALIAATFWFLKETGTGRAIRAVAINPMAARLMGINTGLVSLLVFGAGGAIGAVAGIVIAPITPITWEIGLEYSVKGFTGAIIGGFRSPGRAAAVAMGIGILESLAAGYVSSGSKGIVTYGVLLLYLMLRGGAFVLARRTIAAGEAHH